MWYLAEILFAELPQPDRAGYQCESCNVVFQADDATQAYQKAVAWGVTYSANPPSAMRLLGVSHLTTIGEELGDGTEICGRFFEVQSVWDRVAEFIPSSAELGAIRWEADPDTPLRELLDPEQIAQLKRAWGQGD